MIIHRKVDRLVISHIDAGDIVFVDGSRLAAGSYAAHVHPLFYRCPHSGEVGAMDADNPHLTVEEEVSALEAMQGGAQ